MQEIIHAVERFSGKKIIVQRKTKRKGEPPILVAESTTAQKRLKWSPEYSDIDMIISSAWRWHEFLRQNFDQLQLRDQKIEHLFKNASALS